MKNKFGGIKEKCLYLYKQNTNTMKEMLEIFVTSPLHVKTLLIVYGSCVVLFYSTVVYGVGSFLVYNFKKLF